MCYFVTLGIPSKVDIREWVSSDLALTPAENPALRDLFPAKDTLYYVTCGQCSCGLFVLPQDEQVESQQLEAVRLRHRKLGWSEAKITRAIEAAQKKQGHTLESRTLFLEAVTNLVERFDSLRLFAHFFSGDVEDEPVVAMAQIAISLPEFQETGFPPDQIVEIASTTR